jgi:hypothetical protein
MTLIIKRVKQLRRWELFDRDRIQTPVLGGGVTEGHHAYAKPLVVQDGRYWLAGILIGQFEQSCDEFVGVDDGTISHLS